jgi:hypothetical protein
MSKSIGPTARAAVHGGRTRAAAAGAGRQLGLAQGSHGHARDQGVLEQDIAAAGDRDRGMKFVRPAGEIAKLLKRLGATGRLAEKPFTKSERLVGANDVTVGMLP